MHKSSPKSGEGHFLCVTILPARASSVTSCFHHVAAIAAVGGGDGADSTRDGSDAGAADRTEGAGAVGKAKKAWISHRREEQGAAAGSRSHSRRGGIASTCSNARRPAVRGASRTTSRRSRAMETPISRSRSMYTSIPDARSWTSKWVRTYAAAMHSGRCQAHKVTRSEARLRVRNAKLACQSPCRRQSEQCFRERSDRFSCKSSRDVQGAAARLGGADARWASGSRLADRSAKERLRSCKARCTTLQKLDHLAAQARQPSRGSHCDIG